MATAAPANPNGTYTFASQPRAVQAQRKKYRNPKEQEARVQPVNMMYDPRIVRGNTYRQPTVPAMQQPDPLEVQRQQELARRRAARKRQQQKQRPRTPKAVDGRKHTDVQTELYLEELTDRVEETDISTQTDAFLDRPPSPLFIPPKTGVDVATQILDGELFDFDLEVKPLLEVLVGKTMEQSLMEVMEEEELARLRDHQREFEMLRSAELAEVQRMEEQAARREEEKQQRMAEQRASVEQQKATAEKIAARAFAHSYLSELVPSVFSTLSEGGFFYDRQEREIESQFMPWLMNSVENNMASSATSRLLLDDILRNVIARSTRSLEPAAAPADAPASAVDGITLHVTEGGPEPADEADDAVLPDDGDEAAKPADEAEQPQAENEQPTPETNDNQDAAQTDQNESSNVHTDVEEPATPAVEPEDASAQDADEHATADTVKITTEDEEAEDSITAQNDEGGKPAEVEPRELGLAEETHA